MGVEQKRKYSSAQLGPELGNTFCLQLVMIVSVGCVNCNIIPLHDNREKLCSGVTSQNN